MASRFVKNDTSSLIPRLNKTDAIQCTIKDAFRFIKNETSLIAKLNKTAAIQKLDLIENKLECLSSELNKAVGLYESEYDEFKKKLIQLNNQESNLTRNLNSMTKQKADYNSALASLNSKLKSLMNEEGGLAKEAHNLRMERDEDVGNFIGGWLDFFPVVGQIANTAITGNPYYLIPGYAAVTGFQAMTTLDAKSKAIDDKETKIGELKNERNVIENKKTSIKNKINHIVAEIKKVKYKIHDVEEGIKKSGLKITSIKSILKELGLLSSRCKSIKVDASLLKDCIEYDVNVKNSLNEFISKLNKMQDIFLSIEGGKEHRSVFALYSYTPVFPFNDKDRENDENYDDY